MSDLFSGLEDKHQHIMPGINLFKGLANSSVLMPLIEGILNKAPLRYMMTPMGYPSKVAMSNCGDFGWVSDQHGYRYSPIDPLSHSPWPAIPSEFMELTQQACQLANVSNFQANACLINQYKIGAGLGRHQDKDEADLKQPIVSVSLGLSAIFQVSGNQRSGNYQNILLENGDVLILHGPARLFYHGIKAVKADPLQANMQYRYNLTLRSAV